MNAEQKAFATLQARCALVATTCTRTAACDIVLIQHGGASIFDHVDEANDWPNRLAQLSADGYTHPCAALYSLQCAPRGAV